MTPRMVLLNGGSSSGKSGIARCLQATLPEPWLAIGVDDFVDALPAALRTGGAGIGFADDGAVAVGPGFRRLEEAWTAGLVATARCGANVVVDDVFLGGADSQRRWAGRLGDLPVLWVGVRCAAEVAEAREVARGDRVTGMAARQAETVHEGVAYDVVVDTTHSESLDCARVIAQHLGAP